jgi:hypothetical protein
MTKYDIKAKLDEIVDLIEAINSIKVSKQDTTYGTHLVIEGGFDYYTKADRVGREYYIPDVFVSRLQEVIKHVQKEVIDNLIYQAGCLSRQVGKDHGDNFSPDNVSVP